MSLNFRLRAYDKFLRQAFHAILKETGAFIWTLCVHCFADRFVLRLLTSFFCFRSIIETATKAKFFFRKKRMTFESEKHKDVC